MNSAIHAIKFFISSVAAWRKPLTLPTDTLLSLAPLEDPKDRCVQVELHSLDLQHSELAVVVGDHAALEICRVHGAVARRTDHPRGVLRSPRNVWKWPVTLRPAGAPLPRRSGEAPTRGLDPTAPTEEVVCTGRITLGGTSALQPAAHDLSGLQADPPLNLSPGRSTSRPASHRKSS